MKTLLLLALVAVLSYTAGRHMEARNHWTYINQVINGGR